MIRDEARVALIRSVVRRTMCWNFRLWGFGEAIALRGLLEAGVLLGDNEPIAYVHGLLRAWMGKGIARTAEDHVAPGRELLGFYERTGDAAFLDGARALGALHASFPEGAHGARCHRPDQPGWRHQIWVDCIDVDGPFLARLGEVTGEARWFDRAAAELLAYSHALQDDVSGFYRHGHEQYAGPNGAFWARGNGWALMGLVDTLATLPATHQAFPEIAQRLDRLLAALAASQRADGLWTTILTASDSYAESTLAAMVASALPVAFEKDLVSRMVYGEMARRAFDAVLGLIDGDGGLELVSDATPVGEESTYRTRPFGVFPWGQGPLLLSLTRNI